MKNKEALKSEKANYKEALKNKSLYREKRDRLIWAILNSKPPRWGGIRVTVTRLK